jgi:hypothetical protein
MMYRVDVPLGDALAFPGRCVVCGENVDGDPPFRMSVFHKPLRFTFWPRPRTSQVSVPAHKACAAKLSRRLTLLRLVAVAGGMAGAALAVCFKVSYLWAVMLFLSGLGPVMLWELLAPPKLDLVGTAHGYKLFFSDQSYAREFAELNGSTIS